MEGKAALDIQKLGWHLQLGRGALPANRNKLTEHQLQTKQLCNHGRSRHTQDHSVITPEYEHNQNTVQLTIYRASLSPG